MATEAEIARLAAARNDILFRIHDAHLQLERTAGQLRLYKRGIIPQAEQALKSATAAYRVDSVDFLTMLESEVTLLKYQVEYYRILTDYHKRLADLEAGVGVTLERIRDASAPSALGC